MGDADTELGTRSPGRPEADDAALHQGERVGRYLVLDRLGAGGMGVVYSAYDPELDRKVAIKLLHRRPRGDSPPIERAFGKVMAALFGDDPASADTVAQASSVPDREEQRLLREAQAAARINDPNVVTVHDVGQHRGQVFVAMEFVAGCTLRQWLERAPRSWREIVDVMIAAGSGLAAAHAHNLIHRDFKPDNLMIGDGPEGTPVAPRVRVMDFGLVRSDMAEQGQTAGPEDKLQPTTDAMRSDLTQGGAIVGTPAYMSPEQHLGHPLDARSDQFSFCVALWEALYGVRPFAGNTLAEIVIAVTSGAVTAARSDREVPAALRRIMQRGLAVDPQARWPSMRELVDELRRDPTRQRRFALQAGAALALAGAVAGTWQIDRSRDLAGCRREGEAVAAVWNEEARAQVERGMRGTGLPYAEDVLRNASERLDEHAARWSELRERACTDALAGAPVFVVGERMECFDAALNDLRETVATFVEPDEAAVRQAVGLAAGLRDLDECLDEIALDRHAHLGHDASDRARATLVRRQLRRVSRSMVLGRLDEAVEELDRVTAELDNAPPSSLTASATYERGLIAVKRGAYADAERILADAAFLSARVDDEYTAAAAAAELMSLIGYTQGRPDDAEMWRRWSAVLVERVDGTEDMVGAGFEERAAMLDQSRGNYPAAAAHLEHALSIKRRRLGPDHPEVALVLNSLGNAQIHYLGLTAAETSWQVALAILERALGPSHPDLGLVLGNLAQVRFRSGDAAGAEAMLRRAITLADASSDREHPEQAKRLANLGTVLAAQEKFAEARDALQRSTAILEVALGPKHRSLATSLGTLGQLEVKLGNVDAGLALLRRARAIQEEVLPEDHIDLAVTASNLGLALEAKGELEEALRWHRKSLAICDVHQHPVFTPEAALNVGKLELRLGHAEEAAVALERAVVGLEKNAGDESRELELARAWWGLATWSTDPVSARARIEAARGRLVALGADKDVAEIDTRFAEMSGNTG